MREAASIVVMCELAEELAGGGQLEELRAQLAQLRLTEQPPGIEEAEEAALALERAIGAPPRVASPAFLDEVGAATLALERALGELASPFASALRGATGAVDGFVARGRARLRGRPALTATLADMEGGFGFPFGGDPEDLLRGLREFAEQQAESVQEAQREQFATLTLNTAVELTAAALSQVQVAGAATSRRSRCATPCACSSPRRSRSSAPRARGSCASSYAAEPSL